MTLVLNRYCSVVIWEKMINLELNFLTVFFGSNVTFALKQSNIATKFAIIGGLCISHFVFKAFNSEISMYPVHF